MAERKQKQHPARFPEGLPPEREAARQKWLRDRRAAFEARLQTTLDTGRDLPPVYPPLVGPPPPINAFIDAFMNPLPPGDWSRPSGGGQESFLDYLLRAIFQDELAAQHPINAGPPPGPERAPADPPAPPPGRLGYGVNEAADAAWQHGLPPMGPADDTPEGTITRVADTPPSHPRRTLSFLEELLGRYPLELFQTAPNPTEQRRIAEFLVALELMNEGLQARGEAPVEWADDPTTSGAGNFREFAARKATSPQHYQNMLRKKTREANVTVSRMPRPVRELLAPNVAERIAEGPRGRLTDWAAELLTRVGNLDPTDPFAPADTLGLRTRQINALLSAGPDRSSLLNPETLSQQEAALARQLGGIEQLATTYPDVLGRRPEVVTQTPEQQEAFLRFLLNAAEAEGTANLERIAPGLADHLLPEAGMDPVAQRIHTRAADELTDPARAPTARTHIRGHLPVDTSGAAMPAEEIARANRDILDELLRTYQDDPTIRALGGLDGEGFGVPPPWGEGLMRPNVHERSFEDQLLETRAAQIGTQQPRPPIGQRFREAAVRWQPVGEDPTYPNRLEAMLAREEGSPLVRESIAPDMLEGKPGQVVGLDAANNIRVGGPGGEILSGTLLEKVLRNISQAGRGLGGAALNLGPNLADMYSANSFADAIAGANEQFGGVMVPDSQGNLTPVPINPGMAALYSMVPFLGLDRRRFADDPQYRRQMIGPELIPEIA